MWERFNFFMIWTHACVCIIKCVSVFVCVDQTTPES